jgi:hypothetical protein
MGWYQLLASVGFAVLVTGLLYLPGIRIGFNIGDEGYLYLGSLEVLKGSVPVRDFRAYDPGRYYWCALFMKFFTDRVLAMRLAMGVVVVATVTIVSWLLLAVFDEPVVMGLSALISFVWIRPYYKAFEALFSVMAVSVSFLVLSSPSPSAYVLAGAAVGAALFYGLNHFLYTGLSVAGALTIALWLQDTGPVSALLLWTAVGLCLGLVPTLYLLIRVSGYRAAYWHHKIRPVLERRSSNLAVPRPWIWSQSNASLLQLSGARQLVIKSVFTSMPLIYGVSLLWALIDFDLHPSRSSLVASSAIVGLIYLHHVHSRADVNHVMQGIQPLVLLVSCGAAVLAPPILGVATLVTVLAVSSWTLIPAFDQRYQLRRDPASFVAFRSAETELMLPRDQAAMLDGIRDFVDENSAPGDSVLFAPLMPSFYPLFDRSPAVYDTFCVYPASPAVQSGIIGELESCDAQLAVIMQVSMDGRDDLQFSETHPLIWEHLHTSFEPVDSSEFPELPPRLVLFRRPSA